MKTNLIDILKILLFALMLSIYVLLFGACGTRKVEKQINKEQSTSKTHQMIDNDIEKTTNVDTKIIDISTEFEVVPIDTSKVLIINGKVFKNAKIRMIHKDIKTDIQAKEVLKDQTKTATKVNVVTKKQTKVIHTERKSNPLWNLLWLLIPAAGFVAWKYFKTTTWFL